MADTSGSGGIETSGNQILYTERPYVYIFIPLAIFVTVGLAVTCCQFRRRRRRIRALQLHRDGGRALAQDVEALGATGTSATATSAPPATVNGRPFIPVAHGAGGSRWQWLQAQLEQERALARLEDGLNEFGEAPPPYADASKDTELRVLDASGVAVPPPALTTTTATTTGATATNTREATAATSTSRSSTEAPTTQTLSSTSSPASTSRPTTPEDQGASTTTTTEQQQEGQDTVLPPAYSERPAEGTIVTRPPTAVVAAGPGHHLRESRDR